MLIDSHCHLNLIDYVALESSLSQVIQNATENGVQHMLCVGTDLVDIPNILKITEEYSQVSASIGLHPNEKAESEPTVQALVEFANHPHVVAIGETGLDYYRSEGDLSWQQNRFRNHIHAAKLSKKPLIIHTRLAKEDTLSILREENASVIGGVFHCFTEDWATAVAALDLGFYISFSGIVTFKNAVELQEVAKKVPLDRMLVETDSPYLAPMPFRGKINQPAYVKHVAEFLSKLREIPFEELAHQTTQNFYRLFGKHTIL